MSEYIDVQKMLESQEQYKIIDSACEKYFAKHSNKGDKYCGWWIDGDCVWIKFTYQDYDTDLIEEEAEMFVTFKELIEESLWKKKSQPIKASTRT